MNYGYTYAKVSLINLASTQIISQGLNGDA